MAFDFGAFERGLEDGEEKFFRKLMDAGLIKDPGYGKGFETERVILDEKYFRRMSKFGGKPEEWLEWTFNLGVVIAGVSKKTWEIVEDMMKRDISFIDEFDVEETYGPEFVEKMRGQLFGVLCSVTEEEANGVGSGRPRLGVGS